MSTAVLRVQGVALDIDQCLSSLPASLIEHTWRIGEPRPGGKTSASSGFTVLLSDSDDTARVVEEVTSRLQALSSRIIALRKAGAAAAVDIALYVTATALQSIEIGPPLLAMLADSGVSLRVSAYPTRDDVEQ